MRNSHLYFLVILFFSATISRSAPIDDLLKNVEFRGLSFLIVKTEPSPVFVYRAYLIDKGERGTSLHYDHIMKDNQLGPRLMWHSVVPSFPKPEMEKHWNKLPHEQKLGCCAYSNIRWGQSKNLHFDLHLGSKVYKCDAILKKKGDLICLPKR